MVVQELTDRVAVLGNWVFVDSHHLDNFAKGRMVFESQDMRKIEEACRMALMLFV